MFTRVLLKTGDAVQSGDLIEVVLKITSKNDYDFLAFEDFKPAGCEPVRLRSGETWGWGFYSNLELRDQRIVFFARWFPKGTRVLKYRVRAVTPGDFHVMPARGFAMYAPEIEARSSDSEKPIAVPKCSP